MRISASFKYNKGSCKELVDAMFPIRKRLLIIDLIISAIITASVIILYVTDNKKAGSLSLTLIALLVNNILLGILLHFIPDLYYRSTSERENELSEFDFYDNEFTVKSTLPDGKITLEDCIKYSSIKRVYEKGNKLYICCGKHNIYMLDKDTISNNSLIDKIKKEIALAISFFCFLILS